MSDHITAATSGLFAEVGKIIQHMEAQQTRIADLERQLAEASAPVEFPADGRNDDPAEAAFWRFDARKKGYSRWKGAPQSERDAFKAEYRAALAAPQAADTDKVREAIAALDELADEAEANGNTSAWTNSMVAKVRACLCDEQSATQISMIEQQLEEAESLIAQISHGAAERISSLEVQTKSVDTDKVREALSNLRARVYEMKEAAYTFGDNSKEVAGITLDGVLDEIDAELSSMAVQAPVREVPGWQPIETAPKDGSQIMLTNGETVAQGWWEHQEPYIREQRDTEGAYIDQQEHDGFDGWLDCEGGMQPDPTHWQPLPALPAAPVRQEGETP